MKVTPPPSPPLRHGAPHASGPAWANGVMASLAAFAVAGCAPVTESASRPDLFTGRSTRQKEIVAIVELRKPAALARFPQARHRGAFPALMRHLESLRAEQDAFLASLVALSPEVKLVGRSLFVVNAVSVAVPAALRDRIEGVPGVAFVESAGAFARPSDVASVPRTFARPRGFAPEVWRAAVRASRTLAFVGADVFHAQGHTGEGVRIGVVDTGVDYTHAALGGAGAAARTSSHPA